MREMITPTAWRLTHWLIAIVTGAGFALYSGLLQPREIATWFASRPEVSQAFSEPHFGRADALILVFSTLFLGPFALFLGMVLLVFVLAILGGAVLPVVRWFRLPDWVATATIALAVLGAAWMQSNWWIPRSLWFLGLLARAWKIVVA